MADAPMIAVWSWLMRTSWQAGVLALMVAAIHLLLGRRMEPRWRYALWMLVIIRLLMPATPSSPSSVFNFQLPLWSPIGEGARASTVMSAPADEATTVTIVRRFEVPDPPRSAAAAKPVEDQPSWPAMLVALWLAGVIVIGGRFVIGTMVFARRLRHAAAPDEATVRLLERCRREMGVRTVLRLVPTDAVTGPALFGFMRPMLLIPPRLLRELSAEELRFAFLHELAHVRRRDAMTAALLTAAQVLHWFNPLTWLALARCRAERELACDGLVLSVTGSAARHAYGKTMLKLAESLCTSPPRLVLPATAVGMLQNRSQLHRRITMVADYTASSSVGRWWSSIAPVALLLLVASCAMTDRSKEKPGPAAATSTRDGEATEHPQPPDADEAAKADAVQALLEKRLPEIMFDQIALTDAIDFLRDVTGANIFVNWRTLEAADVTREAPVSARLRNVTFAKALDTILADVGGGKVGLDYAVNDEVITITTRQDLRRNTFTRVYDIRDLITVIPDYEPPAVGATQPATQPAESEASIREQRVQQVMTLIMETVAPDDWTELGSSSIRELHGQLIITAPPDTHQQLSGLLYQLRETRGIQATIETRFIKLDLNALPPALRDKFRQSFGNPGAAKTVFLTDEDTAAILKETQKHAKSTILTAPRVTLFNGQRAYVQVASERAYVSGFTVVKNEKGETRYEPHASTVATGILLDVQATASADRKSITCTLKPRLTRLEAMDTAPWSGAPAGVNDLLVEVPRVLAQELQTTVTIPDGGTLLVSGFTESTSGLPGAPPTTRPASNIFMLVKPTLVIQRPQDPKQFPLQPKPSKK